MKESPSSNSLEEPPKPEKYQWKKSYTLVLVANAAYILLFYFLMLIFQ